MRKNWLLSTVAGLAAFIVAGPVQAQAPAALTGQVSSAEEGNMEGVVVSAKKDGSTITRFAPKTTPDDPQVVSAIEAALPH